MLRIARLILVALQPFLWLAPLRAGSPHDSPRHGVFLADVDYDSGRVTNVRVLQSLGDPKLDAEAQKTFGKWRFKPKAVRQVKLPVTYTAAGMKY